MVTWFYSTPFPLDVDQDVYEVGYSVANAAACVEGAFCQADRRADGSILEWRGMLIIRDRGEPSLAGLRKRVYVARGDRLPCELPDDCGKLIARFQSEHGTRDWYVFSARETAPSRQADDSTRVETVPRHLAAGSGPVSDGTVSGSAASGYSGRISERRGAGPSSRADVCPSIAPVEAQEEPQFLWPV